MELQEHILPLSNISAYDYEIVKCIPVKQIKPDHIIFDQKLTPHNSEINPEKKPDCVKIFNENIKFPEKLVLQISHLPIIKIKYGAKKVNIKTDSKFSDIYMTNFLKNMEILDDHLGSYQVGFMLFNQFKCVKNLPENVYGCCEVYTYQKLINSNNVCSFNLVTVPFQDNLEKHNMDKNISNAPNDFIPNTKLSKLSKSDIELCKLLQETKKISDECQKKLKRDDKKILTQLNKRDVDGSITRMSLKELKETAVSSNNIGIYNFDSGISYNNFGDFMVTNANLLLCLDSLLIDHDKKTYKLNVEVMSIDYVIKQSFRDDLQNDHKKYEFIY
jgi:hypothetical protein